ncbi:MAG: hypothetical protein JWP98_465 [Edaphobacter sp.]|nr:hypothetical protein [Edaphobacter sp.]
MDGPGLKPPFILAILFVGLKPYANPKGKNKDFYGSSKRGQTPQSQIKPNAAKA